MLMFVFGFYTNAELGLTCVILGASSLKWRLIAFQTRNIQGQDLNARAQHINEEQPTCSTGPLAGGVLAAGNQVVNVLQQLGLAGTRVTTQQDVHL